MRHRLRTSGVLALALAVILPAVIVVRLATTTPKASASTVASLTAGGVEHQPWYGLTVLHDTVAFHQRAAAPATPAPVIDATAGILVDADTGEILWSSNPHEALPPASTTKVMTALLTLANYSPSKEVTITSDALNQQWDETKMGLRAGEKLSIQELLTGMMLVSANDAATAVATDTVGYDQFIGGMNAEERALGLHDSHFATPVGLDTPGHLMSPYDEAVIADVAYTHFALFRQTVATQSAELPATPDHQAYSLYNINQLLAIYPAAVGVKPGWTGDAGYCLVAMAVRDNHRLISVLMNAPLVYHQTRTLLDWGFSVDGLPLQYPPTPSPSPAPPHH